MYISQTEVVARLNNLATLLPIPCVALPNPAVLFGTCFPFRSLCLAASPVMQMASHSSSAFGLASAWGLAGPDPWLHLATYQIVTEKEPTPPSLVVGTFVLYHQLELTTVF